MEKNANDEPQLIKHLVQGHETLSSIALKYNMTVNFFNYIPQFINIKFSSQVTRPQGIKWEKRCYI